MVRRFATKTVRTKERVKLHGLKPAVRYALNDMDHPGSPREVTGSAFMESSIELAIADKLESAVLTYERLPGR